MVTLSIGIITKNRMNILRDCLNSVYEQVTGVDYEIIIVDNDSNDGTKRMLKKDFSDVVLISSKKNLGVAGGRNELVKAYNGRYLLFLDDDTKILSPDIESMIGFMDNNPAIGMLGCCIMNPDDTVYPSARKFIKLSNIVARRFSFLFFFKDSLLLDPYREVFKTYEEPVETDWVMGAFQLVKREAQEKIGKLDDIMKYGFQDADFCARLKKANYSTWYYPLFKTLHLKGVVSERYFSKYMLYYLRSYSWFYLKHRDLINRINQ